MDLQYLATFPRCLQGLYTTLSPSFSQNHGAVENYPKNWKETYLGDVTIFPLNHDELEAE